MEWYTNRYALLLAGLPAIALPIAFGIAWVVPHFRAVLQIPGGWLSLVAPPVIVWYAVLSLRLIWRVGVGDGSVVLWRFAWRQVVRREDVEEVPYDRPFEGDEMRIRFNELDVPVTIRLKGGRKVVLSLMTSGLKRRILRALEREIAA
jgi:hypothetical protein